MIDFDALYPNSIGDEVYEDFLPVVERFGDPQRSLWVYVHAIALMFKPADDISKDGPNGEPGWSQIFDLSRAKTEWLPWMGQLVGYHVPPQPDNQTLEEYDARQRERIVTRASWRRGTPTMLRDVIQDELKDPKRVIIKERYGGDPYRIAVWVYADDVATSEAAVRAAALSQKAAGLIMEFEFLTSESYDMLEAESASYDVVQSKFANYDEVLANPGKH